MGTTRSRKGIERLHKETQKYQRITFAEDVWIACNRTVLRLMDRNTNMAFWKKRLGHFYKNDKFAEEYFEFRAIQTSTNAQLSIKEAYEEKDSAMKLLLLPLSKPPFNFDIAIEIEQ